MLPFKSLIAISRNSNTAVYLQIANRLVSLIRDGILTPGSLLPGSREMALTLQVHRKTIVAAYEELSSQDWIETIPRKGVIVSQHLPEIKPRTFMAVSKTSGYSGNTGFKFAEKKSLAPVNRKVSTHRLIVNDGFPDTRIAPMDLLLKEYKSIFQRQANKHLVMFGDQLGSENLRSALVQFLSDTRGLHIGVNNILMSRGAHSAIYMAARMILKPGSTVVVGEPNYATANKIFQDCGAKLIQVAADDTGIDVDAIEKICKKKKPDLLYIIPHHHHPTTVTLSAARRMQLLQFISKHTIPVLEDDYDYDFHYSSSPILPLASASHGGNVIYIGSLSKCLSPSVRVGYMVAPENFITNAAHLKKIIDIRNDDVLEEAIAVLFSNGDMQRHLKKSVKLYHQRRDLFCDLLQNELSDVLSFNKPPGGMACWVKFHKKNLLPVIAQKASAKGLYVSDGSFYNTGTTNYNALRMGFASFNEKEMEDAVSILKKII